MHNKLLAGSRCPVRVIRFRDITSCCSDFSTRVHPDPYACGRPILSSRVSMLPIAPPGVGSHQQQWLQSALESVAAHCSECAQVVRELIERFEAHLTAGSFYSVIANMRGGSAEEVAAAIIGHEGLRGLQVGSSPLYLRHRAALKIWSCTATGSACGVCRWQKILCKLTGGLARTIGVL